VQAAYAAVRTEPLRESAHRAVVRVHLTEGNIVEAARAYAAFCDMLDHELGVAPTTQMEELMSSVRTRIHLPGPVVPGAEPAHGVRAGVGTESRSWT
jgi:DNA-binding SARP family transcriptional activator